MATNNDPRPTGAKKVETHTSTEVPTTSKVTTTKTPAASHEVRTETLEHEAAPSWRASYVGADDQGAAGRNVSWGAILGGVVTMLGVLALLSLLGAAIGLGGTTITSNDPFDGVGTGLAIWGVISLIIAFAAAGLVTGILAGRGGFIHGVVTWAASVLAAMWAASVLVSSAFGLVGNFVGAATNAAGNVVGGVAEVTADAVQGATDVIADNIDVNQVDTQELQQQVEKALRDTDIDELRPEYLQDQLQGASDEVSDAAKELAKRPGDYEQILDNLGNQLQTRIDKVGSKLDRQAVANSLAKNTELDQAEAEQVTDNIIEGYEKAQVEASKQLENAKQAISKASDDIEKGVQQTRETAEDVTNAASNGLIWTFVGLLLGLVITAFCALWGSRMVVGREVSGELRADADKHRTKA